MAEHDPKRQLPMTADQLRRLDAGALASIAADLGLPPRAEVTGGEAIKRIIERQTLVGRLDPTVLDELLQWGGRRPPRGADPYRMAGEAARIRKMAFGDLSDPALRALTRLRGLDVAADADRDELVGALKRAEGLLGKLRRKRRRFIGKLVAMMVGAPSVGSDPGSAANGGVSIKEQIEEHGLVAGLADKLRGAADDYVAVKLDEIEARIDRKLDQIDQRLAEWRDREVANRLRIIKITLAASVIVALISVIYAWCKKTFGL